MLGVREAWTLPLVGSYRDSTQAGAHEPDISSPLCWGGDSL